MATKVRIRTIALPVEHGGWGFLFEPILLALAIVPSAAGLCVAVSAVATFLLRHPFNIFMRAGRGAAGSPRRGVALIASCTYAVIAAAGFVGVVRLAGPVPLVPFAVLSPFGVAFLFYDSKRQSRRLVAEIAGPVGLAGVASSIALAGGWGWGAAAALWALLMARTIPSIFYVRARLRLESGRPFGRLFVFVLHAVFAILTVALWRHKLAPAMTLVAFAVLWGRSLHGLSRFRRRSKAIRIGVLEIIYGVVYVALIVMGYHTGV